MAIGHDKRDLLRNCPRYRTKLRNKNYNSTLNPRNEICTLLWPVGFRPLLSVVLLILSRSLIRCQRVINCQRSPTPYYNRLEAAKSGIIIAISKIVLLCLACRA